MFGMLYQNEIRMIFDVCENESTEMMFEDSAMCSNTRH